MHSVRKSDLAAKGSNETSRGQILVRLSSTSLVFNHDPGQG